MSSSELDGYISILNIRQKSIRQNMIISAGVCVALMLAPLYFVLTYFERWMISYIWALMITSGSAIFLYARVEHMLIKSQIELLQELRQLRRDP
jgi:hypothetical protein